VADGEGEDDGRDEDGGAEAAAIGRSLRAQDGIASRSAMPIQFEMRKQLRMKDDEIVDHLATRRRMD
jgi:hypothetical protein